MDIIIRPEGPSDYKDIFRVNALAFERDNESRLIENLRNTRAFVPGLSIVALHNEVCLGHILFLPINIIGSETKSETLSLAPMAVLPAYQNKGIGSQLVKEGILAAKKEGYSSIVVVGHPGFYPRFGFQRASQWGIRAQFEIPDDVFMAMELQPNGLKGHEGIVEFPEEYNDCMD